MIEEAPELAEQELKTEGEDVKESYEDAVKDAWDADTEEEEEEEEKEQTKMESNTRMEQSNENGEH